MWFRCNCGPACGWKRHWCSGADGWNGHDGIPAEQRNVPAPGMAARLSAVVCRGHERGLVVPGECLSGSGDPAVAAGGGGSGAFAVGLVSPLDAAGVAGDGGRMCPGVVLWSDAGGDHRHCFGGRGGNPGVRTGPGRSAPGVWSTGADFPAVDGIRGTHAREIDLFSASGAVSGGRHDGAVSDADRPVGRGSTERSAPRGTTFRQLVLPFRPFAVGPRLVWLVATVFSTSLRSIHGACAGRFSHDGGIAADDAVASLVRPQQGVSGRAVGRNHDDGEGGGWAA